MSDPTRLEIRTKVAQAFQHMLKRPVDETENVLRSTEPKWDSLFHVELVFIVEDACDVTFAPEQLETLVSLEAFVDAVLAQRQAVA